LEHVLGEVGEALTSATLPRSPAGGSNASGPLARSRSARRQLEGSRSLSGSKNCCSWLFSSCRFTFTRLAAT